MGAGGFTKPLWEMLSDALEFWCMVAAMITYIFLGPKWDAQHNPGLPFLLFTALSTVLIRHDLSGLFDDALFIRINTALPLAIRVSLFAGSAFPVIWYGPDRIASAWLLLCPLPVVALGLPLFVRQIQTADQESIFRAATGLASVGVFAAHFAKHSIIGRAVYPQFHLLWPTTTESTISSVYLAILGAQLVTYYSAGQVFPSAGKQALALPTKIYQPSLVHSHPYLPFNAVAWAIGLVLCVGSIDNPICRATLASTAIAMAMFIAYLPPFNTKLFGLEYRTYLLLFWGIQAVAVWICVAYQGWTVYSASGRVGDQLNSREAFGVDFKDSLPA